MTRIISVVIVFLFACKTTFVHTNNKQPVFDYQGHRGCRGLMPENTIPAMLKAIDLGVTTLETDIVITKDRKPILSHEPIFNHEIATKPNGDPVTEQEEQSLNIYQMDYNVVRTYDVGLKPHPRFAQQQKIAVSKPLLADMIDAAEAYASKQQKALPHYNMETKSDPKTDNTHHPLPAEFVEGRGRGTITSNDGVFSIAVLKGDRITFSSVGFKNSTIKIPVNLPENQYSVIQLLVNDTAYLPATVLRPRPTREQFERDFLNNRTPDDAYEIARKNTEEAQRRILLNSLPADGREAVNYQIRQSANKYYYAGQIPPMNILNPAAWMDFIQAWKRGDFKRKK